MSLTYNMSPTSPALPPNCSDYNMDTRTARINFGVSVLMTFGMFASYAPQLYKIVKRKSAEGISPSFLLLGSLSGGFFFANIAMLADPVVHCCKRELSATECVSASLGIVQIFFQASMFYTIPIFCLIWARRQADQNQYEEIKKVTKLVTASFFVSALVCVVSKTTGKYTRTIADVFGILAALLTCVQYLPQIYTTYTLGHVGSLSIPMMCLQTPGGFVWALSLALRPETKWSTWAVTFVAAVLQGVLLIMAVSFEFRDKKVDERTALLNGSVDDEA